MKISAKYGSCFFFGVFFASVDMSAASCLVALIIISSNVGLRWSSSHNFAVSQSMRSDVRAGR